MIKNLFDIHKKDALPDEQTAVLQEMKTALKDFPAEQEKEQQARWKMIMFGKQIGLNLSGLTRNSDESVAAIREIQAGAARRAAVDFDCRS